MPVIDEKVLQVAEEIMENQSDVITKLAEYEKQESQDRGLAELLQELDNKVMPSLPEVTEEKEIQSDKNLKLDRYLAKFKSRIDAWKASHPEHTPPPIHWDSDYKDWIWINRELRRQ